MIAPSLGPLYQGFAAGYTEALGRSSKSGATITADLATGNVFDISVTANSTLVLQSHTLAGAAYSCMIIVRTTGGPWTISGANMKYPGGVSPSYNSNTVNILTAVTVDGGSNWFMSAAGFAYA